MDLLNLPPQQLIIYLAIGIGTAIAAFKAYQKGAKEQAEPSKDVIIKEATFADWAVMREIAANTKASDEKLAEISEMMAEEFRERARRDELALKEENARLRAELAVLSRRPGYPAS